MKPKKPKNEVSTGKYNGSTDCDWAVFVDGVAVFTKLASPMLSYYIRKAEEGYREVKSVNPRNSAMVLR